MARNSQHNKTLHQRLVWHHQPEGALSAATTAVHSAGGAVVDAHTLSDLHLILRVEIDLGDIPALYVALRAYEFHFPAQPTNETSPAHEVGQEWVVHLAIVLARGTGEKSVPIPAVPG